MYNSVSERHEMKSEMPQNSDHFRAWETLLENPQSGRYNFPPSLLACDCSVTMLDMLTPGDGAYREITEPPCIDPGTPHGCSVQWPRTLRLRGQQTEQLTKNVLNFIIAFK